VLILWVCAYRLHWTAGLPATMWHAHEMVYGFAAAGMAGVLAALVPAWSGAVPTPEKRLAFLAVLWVLGRVAMVAGGVLPQWLVAVIDLSFLPAFAIAVIAPQVVARPARNLLLLLLLAVLWAGDAAMHSEAFGSTFELAERGARIGIDAYLVLIAVIGGYAIPDATNRFLGAGDMRLSARSIPMLDGLSIATVVLYLVSDAIVGMSSATSCIAFVAALLNGARLCLWRGHRVINAPSLLMLHLGYLWMVMGLLLEAAVPMTGAIADMAAIHVLTAGAIGTTLLAVISRESLVHGGRGLTVNRVTLCAYALVSLAVVLRIAALIVPGAFVDLVIISGVIWALGFTFVLASYLPAR
jgi:uncharacterized protein involved in response to NO